MAGKEVEYIYPPNNLRQKQKLAGVTGTIDAAWMEAAERSILAAKFDYIAAAGEDLAKLQAAYDAALKEKGNREEHVKALYAMVQSIKGQGTSFGYPLMTAVGNQLARFVEDSGDNLTDAQLNWQYRAFGVPGLGLKRGLADDLVVAPYATALALLVDAPAAVANLRQLADPK